MGLISIPDGPWQVNSIWLPCRGGACLLRMSEPPHAVGAVPIADGAVTGMAHLPLMFPSLKMFAEEDPSCCAVPFVMDGFLTAGRLARANGR
jgi:hypothetical protein